MSAMNRLSAVTRWMSPASIRSHSRAGMMRGTKSKGKMRSSPSFSPYTVKVMPWSTSEIFCSRSRRAISVSVNDSSVDTSGR